MAAAVALVGVLACDGDETTGSGEPDYWPNADGNTWDYNTTDSEAGTYETSYRIAGARTVGGVECQEILIYRSDLPNESSSRFIVDNDEDLVYCYGEEFTVDSRVTKTKTFTANTYRYPFTVGATWTVFDGAGVLPSNIPFVRVWSDDVDHDGIDDACDVSIQAEVVAREDVTVPAGTFAGSYRVRHTSNVVINLSSGGNAYIDTQTDNWVHPSVGIVKMHIERAWRDGGLDGPDSWECTSDLLSYDVHLRGAENSRRL
jgi:hypothetical protein